MSVLLRLCFSLLLLAPALVHAATLENPANGSFYSGIGVISGWKCTANGPLTVRFNGGDAIPLAYLNERGDTAGVCGDTNNGFVAIMNWAILGDGTHTAVAYDNGVEFARSTFTVATTGEPYVTGAEGECRVPNFPAPGETMPFAWNEATQHLEMVGGNSARSVMMQASRSSGGTSYILSCLEPDFACFDYIFDSQALYASLYASLAASCREDGHRVLSDTESCPPGPGCYDPIDTGVALQTTVYGLPASDVQDICTEVGATFVPDTGSDSDDTDDRSGGSSPAALENPRNGSFYSGIGVISGWKCEANGPLTVRFNDGDAIPLAYLNERGDTASVCGDANNGFVAIMNWAILGDGTHTAVVYDNGIEFARSTFTVATTGEPYVTGAAGECRVPDFPAPGETVPFVWNEATQHLEMVGVDDGGSSGGGDGGGVCDRTPQVRDAIMGILRSWGVQASCEDITAEHLARIESLGGHGLNLTTLKDGDFAGLPNLRVLFLHANQLTSLPPDLFRGLSNLDHLALHENQLTSLPPDLFKGLSNLDHLKLEHNQLTSLPPGVFRGLSNLKGLWLGNNQLTSLPPGVFRGLPNLRVLFLHANQLTSLPPDLFRGLSNLENLALHENQLTSLPPGVFRGLSNLRGLGLGNNQLTSLPPGVFRGLSNLRGLGLGNNQLTSLPPGVFRGLFNLSILELGNNQLTSLPPGAFADLPDDTEIYLEGNPGYPFPTDGRGGGGGTVDCNNAWTGSQGDFQVVAHCLAACAAAQAGDIQGRDANCSILRTYERHYPGTVLRYCPVRQ